MHQNAAAQEDDRISKVEDSGGWGRPASESWDEQTNLSRRKQDSKTFLLDQIETFL